MVQSEGLQHLTRLANSANARHLIAQIIATGQVTPGTLKSSSKTSKCWPPLLCISGPAFFTSVAHSPANWASYSA